jgi:hypothetical protein
MKASDFNKKPEQKVPKLTNTFTGDHLVKIVKSIVGLGVLYLFISFGKWGVEFLAAKNLRIVDQSQVDSAVVRLIKPDTIKIVKPDTLTIPVEYEYVDSHFKSNGDTTYWFITGSLRGPKDFYQGVSRVIKLPYSAFNFYQAAELMRKGTKEANDAFIENFIQISKASYLSYRKYADNN